MNFVAETVAAVVVTRNRQALLAQCLEALRNQRYPLTFICVVDNASGDGTRDLLASSAQAEGCRLVVVPLEHNVGGAGGFARGMECALATGADWVWLMDDDAVPMPDALQNLLLCARSRESIYGSVAGVGDQLAWPVNEVGEHGPIWVQRPSQLRAVAAVETLPFVGFLIHRDLVAVLGLPDADLFIAGDDVEYSLRARKAGIPIFAVRASFVGHPLPKRLAVDLGCRTFQYLSLAPLKRYYDTRNRLLIARLYHGARLYTEAIPGTLVRLLLALTYERGRLAQLRAFIGGFVDGMRGIKGQRHHVWGIGD